MSAVRKYAFDTVFSPDGAVLRDGSGFRAQFTRDEVEAVKASAFEDGRADSMARAEESSAQALQRLANEAARLLSALETERAALRAEAAQLAMTAARLVAGKALEKFGEDRIASAVEQAMDQLRQGPRLIIRVPTNSYGALRPRLEGMAQASAYPAAIMVREEPQMSAGDVIIEWADGAIALDRDALFSRAEEIIDTALNEDNRAQAGQYEEPAP